MTHYEKPELAVIELEENFLSDVLSTSKVVIEEDTEHKGEWDD